jgi:hypothetical protein
MAWVSGAQLFAMTPALSQSDTDTKIFGAFTAFCGSDLLDVEAARSRAGAQGWEPADESASPRLLAMGKFARTMQSFVKPDSSHLLLFKRTIGARLIIGRLSGSIKTGVQFCDVYDFDAQNESYGAMVRKWLGSEPKRTIRQPGYLSEEWYRPSPRFLRVQSSFAASTPNGEKLGWVGARLGLSQVEKSRDKF